MQRLQISLAAARVNAGLTQKELAEKLEVSNVTIVKWENGTKLPTAAQLHFFCSVCGVSEDDIILPEILT